MPSENPSSPGLSTAHRRFLWIDQGVVPIVFNFFLNAGIAWLTVRSLAAMPLWGSQSVAVDTFATAFLLPFFTALVVTRLVAGQVAAARVPPLPPQPSSPWLARSSRARGARLGIASMFLAALPVVLLLSLFGPDPFERSTFIWFKAAFAAALAGVVTPIIGWWALIDASTKRTA
jgi:hypothetical protein